MTLTPRIAVVDDEVRMALVLAMVLRREGYEVVDFNRAADFLAAFDAEPFDLVMTDLKMPDMDGIALLGELSRRAVGVPVVLLTAHGTVANAIEAMKLGAYDFVEKPFDNKACMALVRRALEHTRLERENRYLRAALPQNHRLSDVIVESEPMRQVFDLARRAAKSRATVLVSGESGTGKELVARSIHYHSQRVGEPFVGINCKAFASSVLESELFGHARGAFTGAHADRKGVFARAHRGTLFLDEIGDVDMAFQTKLLRVLQEHEVQPVGAAMPTPVDVRVVAATNRDLRLEVREGRFREDLYFRLAVIPIHLPPLRQRRAEIIPLARHFLSRWRQELSRDLHGWTPEVEAFLVSHDWPGNVRELENTIERAAVLAPDPVITLADLMLDEAGAPLSIDATLEAALNATTTRHVRAALAHHDTRQAAADALGIDRTTIYRLMKRHGISS